jgi:sugar lactone lactonase YvrE
MRSLPNLRRQYFVSRIRLVVSWVICLLLLGAAQPALASFSLTFQGYVQTINTGGSITLSSPSGIVVDPAGDIFIADTVSGSGRIVEVNAQGTASVLTISGLSPALGSLAGIAIDGAGNLYVVDSGNTRVVKVSSSGAGSVISTGSVTLTSPQGIALDQSGDIFISDGTGVNSQIVEVTSGGSAAALSITVSTSPTTLDTPKGMAVDVSGNLYITDSASGHNRIVKLAAGSTTGVVVSIAGGVTLTSPSDVAVDRVGNIFICDHPGANARIAEVDTSGTGSVLLTDSVTLSNGAAGVALDVFGTVYIADTGNSRGLIVDPPLDMDPETGGYTSSLNRSVVGFGHIQLGSSSAVTLTVPFTTGISSGLGGVKVFTSGTQNLDFTATPDTTCNSSTTSSASCSVVVSFLPTAPGLRTGSVVLYDPDLNPILTLPLYGWGDSPVAALTPNAGSLVNTGGVNTNYPYQLALDGAGNMYVGNYVQDGSSPKVVKIPAGGGTASAVSTSPVTLGTSITGVAVDGAGNLFIADYYHNQIVVVTPGGAASILSISGLSPALGEPTELAFDGAGNLYIGDYAANGRSYSRVVEISSLFVLGSTSRGIGTVLSTGSYTFSSSTITGVTVGPNGTVYIAARTSNSSHVVQVTATGVASLLNPNGVSFTDPQGVFVDGMGNLYVENSGTTGSSPLVRVTTDGVVSTLNISGLTSPSSLAAGYGVTTDSSGNLYIPDWNNSRIVFANVSGAALTFPSTGRGSTSAAETATVTNLGNQPLVFSANPTYTANFSENSGDTNPCTSSTSLSSGMDCDVSVEFTPQSVGLLSAGITVTDNTLNVAGSTQQVSVSGASVSSADTTAVAVSVTPTSVTAGQSVTVTATVTDTVTGHNLTVPTGSVTFTDMVGTTATSLSAATLTAGTATLTGVVLSGTGVHTITANYAGVAGSFNSSSNTATVTVSPDFTITVPTGSSPSATAPAGGTAVYTLSFSPTSATGATFPNAVNFTVSGLPPGATATVSPNPIPAGSPANTPFTLTIRLGGQTAALHRNMLRHGLALVMIGMLLLPFGRRVRRATGKRVLQTFLLVFVLAGAGATLGLTSCGGHNSGYLTSFQKSYVVTVTATSGSVSHSITVNLTVQ